MKLQTWTKPGGTKLGRMLARKESMSQTKHAGTGELVSCVVKRDSHNNLG
jgi:hypothetical protein